MSENYIVQGTGGKLFSFYCGSNCLYMREYEENKWGRVQVLICQIREHISIFTDDTGIYIICQEVSGSVYLCRLRDKEFSKKIIAENKGGFNGDIYINAVVQGSKIRYIYNSADKENHKQFIVSSRGNSQVPEIIDSINSGMDKPFKVVYGDKIFLFYKNSDTLYCREITAAEILDAQKIFMGNITDYSVVWAEDSLHIALAVKTRLSSQIIYINGNNSAVVTEANNIKMCRICRIKDEINIYWNVGNRLFRAREFNGEFRNCDIKMLGNDNYAKANYISNIQNKDFQCSEVIVNNNRPYEICFNNEIYGLCVRDKENSEQTRFITQLNEKVNSLNVQLEQKESEINQLKGFKNKSIELQKENIALRQRCKELWELCKSREKQLPMVVENKV